MKKYLSTIICLILISLCGCGATNSNKETEASESTEISENIEETTEGIMEIEYINPFSDDRAWIYIKDNENNVERWGCINKEGKMLFITDKAKDMNWTYDIVTSFSNGYSTLSTNNKIYVIDENGKIVNQIIDDSMSEERKVKATSDAYTWVEEYVGGFDESYYTYTLIDPIGNEITQFEYQNPYDNTKELYDIRYCENGVWNYSDYNEEGDDVERFYCTKNNSWHEFDIADNYYINDNISFYGDTALIGHNDSNLLLMSIDGKISEINIPENMLHSWDSSYLYEDYLVSCDHSTVATLNVKTGEINEIGDEFSEKLIMDLLYETKLFVKNGQIALPLEGQDEYLYVMVFDEKLNPVSEAIQSNEYELTGSNWMIDEGTLNVYNTEGILEFTWQDKGYIAVTVPMDGVIMGLPENASKSAINLGTYGGNIITEESIEKNMLLFEDEWIYLNEEGDELFEKIDMTEAIEIILE